jgi:putative addiction module killer protein
MIEVRQTEVFARWLIELCDRQARARINSRIRRLTQGNFGDVKSIGEGISELRIDYGPGYRVYFTRIGSLVVLLLVGGTKKKQLSDIERAKAMAKEVEYGS